MTPEWKRELVLTVAGLLGRRESDVAAAAMIVQAADAQFGMSRAVSAMPADKQDDPSSIDFDGSGQPLPNAFVDAVNTFWAAVGKLVRTGGAEKAKDVKAALKERGRSAWLHVGKEDAAAVVLLSAEVLAQVRTTGWPELWSGGMGSLVAVEPSDDDYTTVRYAVPMGRG